ncbi:nuclear transport factor 2 family protein [Govanella unica]|uniref:Nuclear transport factor 2 family protein n=1 Tax=Govanella unica TaxID=2975056 RepID=A0A9X3TZT8_9PROT|nr:nuclear transport factor 2 family protein [Govania unica]MDA5194439.1 nuclear transport factor 2 family protein [Govania unica]
MTKQELDKQAIEHAEKELAEALVTADLERLLKLLDDGLLWIHGSSKVDTKTSLLEAIANRSLVLNQFDREYAAIEIFGESGVVAGILNLDVTMGGEPRRIRNQISTIWSCYTGVPCLIHFQATRVPD